MEAVAYLRVSTQDQSLERQYDDIKKFAENKGLTIVKVFEDKISGSKTKTDDRSGFNEMDKYLNLNENIRDILVLEISRLGRKNNDIQNVVEKYIERGINIHINDLSISTLGKNGKRSFASEMMISMLGVMAANESRLLSARISSGKMSRARKNLAFGGKIIGYKKGEDGQPVIDEEESPIIEHIFELAAKGLGMRNISAIIESEFGREIAIGTLGGIIRNSFHKGLRIYKHIELPVPAIVSNEVWQKANDFINSRKKFGSRTNVNTNIIQGKINCECGNVMYQKVIPKGRIDIFICKDIKCKNSINRPWLFRMIRKVVERHAQKTKDEQVRESFKLQIMAQNAKIENNTKALLKLEKRLQRTRELYADLEFTKEEYNKSKIKIGQEIEIHKTENSKLIQIIKSSENALKKDLNQFSKNLEVFKFEIQDIIHKVIIHNDSVIIGVYNLFEYDLDKPNSTMLGWESRKPENERFLNEKLPLRHPIDYENLEIMINSHIAESEGLVEEYLNSEEYKEKGENEAGLGSK